MLLHAFFARAGADSALPASGDRRPADLALLTAVSMCFALGADTVEQFKHLAVADAGPLAGLGVLPGLRTMRTHLARIADAADPVAVQAMFASAMLAADPVTSGVYYVDDHFIPYTGAKPVAKGWNNKRGRAERGRADTHVTAHDGRAVCFVTGEPSGLSVTLPRALAELKRAAGPAAKIMLGFDRGGAYPQVFAHCRAQDVHWVTYRRAPLAVPGQMPPVITAITYGGRTRQITWAEETVQVKDYGEARQITLFEHGRVALQILTSDTGARPVDIRCPGPVWWREENFLKYASVNYGIDKICDYLAAIEVNTKIVDNPARKAATAAVRKAEKALAGAERELAGLLDGPRDHPSRQEQGHPRPAGEDHPRPPGSHRRHRGPQGHPRETARQRHRPRRRGLRSCAPGAAACRWSCGSSPTTPSTGYRTSSTPTCATRTNTAPSPARASSAAWPAPSPSPPAAITVTLEQPRAPRIARATALLIQEINATPPAIPGDHRPITYHLAPKPSISTPDAQSLPEIWVPVG